MSFSDQPSSCFTFSCRTMDWQEILEDRGFLFGKAKKEKFLGVSSQYQRKRPQKIAVTVPVMIYAKRPRISSDIKIWIAWILWMLYCWRIRGKILTEWLVWIIHLGMRHSKPCSWHRHGDPQFFIFIGARRCLLDYGFIDGVGLIFDVCFQLLKFCIIKCSLSYCRSGILQYNARQVPTFLNSISSASSASEKRSCVGISPPSAA